MASGSCKTSRCIRLPLPKESNDVGSQRQRMRREKEGAMKRGPRQPEDCPKTGQDSPQTAPRQDPKRAAPKSVAQDSHQRPQDSRQAKTAPRQPQTQDSPKTSPRQPPSNPKTVTGPRQSKRYVKMILVHNLFGVCFWRPFGSRFSRVAGAPWTPKNTIDN